MASVWSCYVSNMSVNLKTIKLGNNPLFSLRRHITNRLFLFTIHINAAHCLLVPTSTLLWYADVAEKSLPITSFYPDIKIWSVVFYRIAGKGHSHRMTMKVCSWSLLSVKVLYADIEIIVCRQLVSPCKQCMSILQTPPDNWQVKMKVNEC